MDRVELFRAGINAFNGGDVEAFLAFIDPEVEWYPFLEPSTDAEPYRGLEGARKWLRNVHDTFDYFSARADEIRELDDRLVALGEIRYRVRGSDVEASAPIAWVVDFRGELISCGRVFMRHEEALEAAGLAPESTRLTR